MKKFIYSSLVALTAISAAIPVVTTNAEARRGHGHGRGLAIGAGVLLGAAALAAGSRRSYAGDRHYYNGGSQCRRWRWRCNDGSDWACDKYDRHC